MNKTICGIKCDECMFKDQCNGCVKTGGKPFGGHCMVAECAKQQKLDYCADCNNSPCKLRKELIKEINDLHVKDMDEVKELYSLVGRYVNLEYTFSNGQKVQFYEDDVVYLGNQLPKKNSNRYYGIVVDEHHIMICEYGENGIDPEIVLYKKRK